MSCNLRIRSSTITAAIALTAIPAFAQNGNVNVLGVFNSSPPSLSSGQYQSLQLDSSARLLVNCGAGCGGSGGTSLADENTFTQGTTTFTPVGGIFTTAVTNLTTGQAGVVRLTNDRMMFVNVGDFGGSAVVTGTGASGAGIPRVTVSNDSNVLVTQSTAAASTAGWPITGGNIAESTAAWTSATAQNTTLRLTITGYNRVYVTLNQGSTITGGVVTFEASDTTAFTNAYLVQCEQTQAFAVGSTYTLVATTNQAFDCDVAGAAAFQVRLSTAISGTATVNVGINTTSMAAVPLVTVGGTVTSNQGTTPWVTNITQFGSNNVVTGTGASGTGIPRVTVSNDSQVRILGNAGAIVDFAGQNAAAPANEILTGCVFNTAPTTVTNGNGTQVQCDASANVLVDLKTAIPAGTNLIGYTRPQNGCGTTNYEALMQYLPSASTQLTATATCLTSLLFFNKDTTQHTVTVQDQSTGCNAGVCQILTTYPLPANTGWVRIALDGTKFVGGLKWNADAANVVVANALGNQ
jgi:hypothetical protein